MNLDRTEAAFRAVRDEAARSIDGAYWAFTRQARAMPPPHALYERLETARCVLVAIRELRRTRA